MNARVLVSLAAFFAAGASELQAQFIWTGAGADGDVRNPANWQGGAAPTGGGSEYIVFSAEGTNTPVVPVPFSVGFVMLTAFSSNYIVTGTGALTLNTDVTTEPGTYGLLTITAPVTLATGVHNISLGGQQGTGADVTLLGAIDGPGSFIKWGVSTLTIDHAGNSFSGYVELEQGQVRVHGDGALGTGPVYFNGGSLVALDTHPGSLTTVLTNEFNIGPVSDFGEYGGKGSLTITGTTYLQVEAGYAQVNSLGDGVLTFGSIIEAVPGTSLVVAGSGVVRVAGETGYTGGTHAQNNATVIFASALPSTGLLVAHDDSYIGTERTTNIQASFLSRFDPVNTIGIVGFDTPNLAQPAVVSELIDLSYFDPSVRVGTATAAFFTGTITPGAFGYRFGGRGTLTILSALTGETSVEATSGLLLFLKGANQYYGPTRAGAGAAIVFAGSSFLSGTTFNVDAGSYLGSTETTGLTVASFLNHFNQSATFGVIGFDTENIGGRIVGDPIILTGFQSDVYLGTATQATLAGPITPAAGNYQFTGFRDGQLTVSSALSGSAAVYVGQPQEVLYSSAPGGVTYSPSVTLIGDNSYTGGTYLQSGRLRVGNTAALGTGMLHLTNYQGSVGLESTVADLGIPNPIVFENYSSLTLGGANDFTLFGNVNNSVNGLLDKIDTNTVTLTGDNSAMLGKVQVHSGVLRLDAQYAAGMGPVSLLNFDGVYDGQLVVLSPSAYVHDLTGENQTKITLESGNLVVDQTSNTQFSGQITGTGALVKIGSGSLTLTGSSVFSGGTEVNGGTVTLDGATVTHSSGDVTVGFADGDNGSLQLIRGAMLANQNANIGHDSGSIGQVLVSRDSAWHVVNNLSVGLNGDGSLAVETGGAVTSLSGYVGVSGIGWAAVRDPGSSWNLTNELVIGGFGVSGQGNLSISNGGAVSSGVVTIGQLGVGQASVDGFGSTLHSDGGINVGTSSGSGSLIVQNGGIISSAYSEIGNDFAGGYVVITGLDSAWNVVTSIDVGLNSGSGNLMVMDGAQVNVGNGTGTISIGVNGGVGALVVGQSPFAAQAGIINVGTLLGNSQVQFATAATSAIPYYLTRDGTALGTPVVISGGLTVLNFEGYNVLNGANTYTGGTYLNGGTLVVAVNNALGTGGIVFNGGRLSIASGVTLNNPIAYTGGGVLGGNGTFGNPVTVGAGVDLAPGNSVGLLTFANGTTWGPGGTYDIEVQSATGTRGVGYDSINVTGGLTFTATLGAPFTLNLISLDAGGNPGAVSDFSSAGNYSWLIAQTDGLSGFDPANISVATTSFTNNLGTGLFTVSAAGNNVYVNFSPVPEPATWMLFGLGLAAFVVAAARRFRGLPRRR
ncbi:MAG: autotransporter-associated beta strand repeat-containing protein [Verrucomicrobia bacterium]|nr:autotransporter-associated beta strand repeat-containing protein [Verrucomicrobiota bacterium]